MTLPSFHYTATDFTAAFSNRCCKIWARETGLKSLKMFLPILLEMGVVGERCTRASTKLESLAILYQIQIRWRCDCTLHRTRVIENTSTQKQSYFLRMLLKTQKEKEQLRVVNSCSVHRASTSSPHLSQDKIQYFSKTYIDYSIKPGGCWTGCRILVWRERQP